MYISEKNITAYILLIPASRHCVSGDWFITAKAHV